MSGKADAARCFPHGGLDALRRRHAFDPGGGVDFSVLIPRPEPDAGYSHVVLHSAVWLDDILHVADISGHVAVLRPDGDMRMVYRPELRFGSSLAWNPRREAFVCVAATPCGQEYETALCELSADCSLRGVTALPSDMRLPFETLVHDDELFVCDSAVSRVHVLDASTLAEKRRMATPGLTPLLVRSGPEGVYLANCRRGQWVPGRHASDLRQRIWHLDAEDGSLRELLRFHETQTLVDFCFLGAELYVLVEHRGLRHFMHKYDASLQPVYRVDLNRRMDGRGTYLRSMSPGPGRVFIGGYAGTPFLLEILVEEGRAPFLPVEDAPWV